MNGIEHWLTDCVTSGVNGLGEKAVAVDVGANTGTWTAPLADLFETVVAIEPDSRASDSIQRLENVQIVSAAVGRESGSATFYKRATTGHGCLTEAHPIGGEGMAPVPVIATETVSVVSLDDLLADGADFVKMDIEGGEVDALAGCKDGDRWRRTFFVVECHDTFPVVLKELERLGKRVTRVPHPYHSHPGHCWAIGEP